MRKLFLALASLLLISSCSKDDLSSEGSAVLWYGENTANELLADGAISLTYHINGSIEGSSAANVYYTSSPDCGSNGTITFTERPGTYTYTVEDQTGFEYWKGFIEIESNSCVAIELVW